MVSIAVLAISVVAGAILAGLVIFLLAKQKQSELLSELKLAQAQKDELKSQNTKLETEKAAAAEQVSALLQERAALQTRLSEQEKNLKEQVANLEQAKTQLKLEFENLAQKILDEKGTKFSEQSKEQLSVLLNPFKEQMAEFKKKVEDVYVDEKTQRVSLKNEIDKMHKAYETLSEEANNLVRALKADTKTQGDWGEIILNRILENSGLKEGIHYQTQASFKTEEERQLRPDVIIQLPGNRQIVVDSKVSIKAYETYYNASTEQEREEALKAHVRSIRNHIRELSAKKYDNIEALTTLDFVFMFIPIEAAFMVALDTDRELFTEAYNLHVLLVCPSTLLVTLQMINSIWRVEYQNRNSLSIADQGKKLLEKLVGFMDNMEKIQTSLAQSQKAYTEAYGQLFSGKGNLISQAKKLLELGVKASPKAQDKLVRYTESAELLQLEDETEDKSKQDQENQPET
jgi:DNA recombination protein RmuC